MHLKTLLPATAFAALLVAGLSLMPAPGRADNDNNGAQDEKQMIQVGLSVANSRGIALNMKGKDPDMVGLGSYLVNVAGDCNGCHTANPATEYTGPGNPYLLHPPNGPFMGVAKVNPATYLGGGSGFGTFPTTTGTVDIIARNLTPDYTGLPEGGHTLSDFIQIMRTGVDLDHLHLNMAPPFNGALLQVMPWPGFQNMTDRQLKAIYTFLSAIPCIDTSLPGHPELHNVCSH